MVHFGFISIAFVLSLGTSLSFASDVCPPIILQNGRVKIRSRNRVARFRCRRKFMMIGGDRSVTCSLGVWRGTIPKCIGAGCSTGFQFPNGQFLLLFGNALAKFECDSDYILEGSPALSCNSRTWNDTTPVCQLRPQSPYECKFESSDVCGWDIENNRGVYEWQWGKAYSVFYVPMKLRTRPYADHSTKFNSGHYLYIEAAHDAGVEAGTLDRVYSPVLQPFISSPSCVTFWYWIKGETTGEINVYLKPQSEDLDIQAPEATISGDTNGEWKIVYISLQDMDEPYQVVIEAVYGDGYMSDVSIDDFLATFGDNCLMLEMQYITQTMEDTDTENGTMETPPEGMIPITRPIPTSSPNIIITAAPPETTTLAERTTPPTPAMNSAKSTPLTTITSKEVDISTTSQDSIIPTTFISTTQSTTTPLTTTTSSTTRSTSSTTTSTTRTTSSSTTSPTTSARETTTKKTTTPIPSVETSTSTTRLTTKRSYITTEITTFETETPIANITLPVPNEITSAVREKAFFSYLTTLLVSLGIAFTVVLLVFIYKKCGDLKQSRLSEDSDVKYLQQGDDDYHGVEDSDSMIYHPKMSRESIRNSMTSEFESSASTSIASSIGSTNSDSSSSRKPIRPPPPIPSKLKEQSEWSDEHQLINIDLSTDENTVISGSHGTNDFVSTTQSLSSPPPVPPRSFNSPTSV